jgi:enoyl-CoA hydratase
MSDQIVILRDGFVATLVLDRPEKLNAITKPMWKCLGERMTELSNDDQLRCVVLRGAGGKAFSPGNDISEFETERSNPTEAKDYGKLMHLALAALKNCRHPTVALIEGICVGGGLEIAACCDMRICGQSSRFGVPINKLGLVMAYPEISALVNLVGHANAAEILFEGQIFGSERAREMGIVSKIVPDDAVAQEAYATAKRIAEGAPLVARWHKKFLNRLADPAPLTESEIDEGYECFATEDFKIGYSSFLKKETPDFQGR